MTDPIREALKLVVQSWDNWHVPRSAEQLANEGEDAVAMYVSIRTAREVLTTAAEEED